MRFRLVASALLLSACNGWGFGPVAPEGGERAAALARSWARHVGAPGRELDASGDMKLGETGLLYDRSTDTLYGRVYVNMALIKGMSAHDIEMQRRMVATLNDPAIGQMYDQGGGHFVLDEPREAYYLVRAFPVARTDPKILIRDMERMRMVAPRWTTKWFFQVSMIMHGNEAPPTHRVTLTD